MEIELEFHFENQELVAKSFLNELLMSASLKGELLNQKLKEQNLYYIEMQISEMRY